MEEEKKGLMTHQIQCFALVRLALGAVYAKRGTVSDVDVGLQVVRTCVNLRIPVRILQEGVERLGDVGR